MNKRLIALRKALKMTQGEFAERLGLRGTSLSMVEQGRNGLTEQNIKLICMIFNVNEQWLRTGEGEMFGSPSPYEKELLELYRQLPEETQDFILDMVRTLLKKHMEKAKKGGID